VCIQNPFGSCPDNYLPALLLALACGRFSNPCRPAAVGLHPIDFARLFGDAVDMKNTPQLLKRMTLLFLFIALVAVAGMGCHTANGFGQDMKDAGQGIQNGTK
jgi:predicted small secreted protein